MPDTTHRFAPVALAYLFSTIALPRDRVKREPTSLEESSWYLDTLVALCLMSGS